MAGKNKALKTLYVFNGLFVLAGSLLGPLYAIYVAKITSGAMSIAISWSVFLFSTTVFSYLVAKLGDRVKEKESLLMVGFLVRAICWLAYIFVTKYDSLLVVQFVLGFGEAIGSPAFDAIFAEHLDKGRHIKDYSDWRVVSNLALVIGTILGGYVVQNFGFNYLFILMSTIAFVCFGGILMKPRKLL